MKSENFQNVIIPPKIAGLKSLLPDFSLAWQINRSFNINLALNLNWKKHSELGKESLHRHYFCYFEDVELNWHLIQNKGSHGYFIQSKPMFDYLLICNGEDIYHYFEKAIDAIKANSEIEHVFPFEFHLLKQQDNIYNNIQKTKFFIDDL